MGSRPRLHIAKHYLDCMIGTLLRTYASLLGSGLVRGLKTHRVVNFDTLFLRRVLRQILLRKGQCLVGEREVSHKQSSVLKNDSRRADVVDCDISTQFGPYEPELAAVAAEPHPGLASSVHDLQRSAAASYSAL